MRALLIAVLAAGACDPRVYAKDEAPDAAPAVHESDDSEPPEKSEPFSPFAALGALNRPHVPGPFEEQTHSPTYKKGAAYAAVLRLEGEVAELDKPFELSLSLITGGGGGPVIGLRDLRLRLMKLDADDQIDALLLRFDGVKMSMAVAEELRATMAHLKKPVDCHFESADNIEMFLASACKSITIAPAGEVVLNGPAAAPMYFKGLLDLLGVEADFIHVGAYKGAAEPFTRSEPSPAMQQTYTDLLDGAYASLSQALASGRHVDAAKVAAWVDQALFDAEQAKSAGLVDNIATFESWRDGHGAWKKVSISEKQHGVDDLMTLIGLKPKKRVVGPHVALIYAVGEIVDGDGSPTGAFSQIASGRLAPAFYAAAADDDVKAIVLRVDSPGGSALAADVIWQAVRVAAARKPVIVSMGGLAASGGYYISSAGQRIFAQPDTLTGSIGVIGGKIVLAPALARYGVNFVELGHGKRAHIMSAMHKWTDEERAALDATMESVYVTFKARVALGRHTTPEAIEPNAQGRVFIGTEALKRGLVDEIGGLDDALAYARKTAKLGDDVAIEVYPQELSLLDTFGGFGRNDVRLSADGALSLSSLASASLASIASLLGPDAAVQVDAELKLLSHFAGDPIRVVCFVPAIR